MRAYWTDKESLQFINLLKIYFKSELEKNIFSKYGTYKNNKLKNNESLPFTVNVNPYLHGYWGGDCHTMSDQSCLLGIIGIQFEIPVTMRNELYKNEKLFKQFSQSITKLYKQIIIPNWYLKNNNNNKNSNKHTTKLNNIKDIKNIINSEYVNISMCNVSKKDKNINETNKFDKNIQKHKCFFDNQYNLNTLMGNIVDVTDSKEEKTEIIEKEKNKDNTEIDCLKNYGQ